MIITNSAGIGSPTDPTLADNFATITTTIDLRRLFLPVIRR